MYIIGAKNTDLEKGEKVDFLSDIKPMLATLVDKPSIEPRWMYELK